MADAYEIRGTEELVGRGANEGVSYGQEDYGFWSGDEYPSEEILAPIREWADDDQVRFIQEQMGVATVTQAVDVKRSVYIKESRARFVPLFRKIVSVTALSEKPELDQVVYSESA